MSSRASMALFFTRGMSLAGWDAAGMLSRETALYRRHLEAGRRVALVTYGGPGEREIAERVLPGAVVCCNEGGLPLDDYAANLAGIHARELSRVDVFKTNQVSGSREALDAARALGKPLAARCGYLLSDFAARMHGRDSREAREALAVEAQVFSRAGAVVVATRDMARDVLSRVPGARVEVVPNYVSPEFFVEHGREPEFDVCFVGRLAPQKNVLALLEALEGLNLSCLLVGDGELRDEVRERAGALGPRVRWEARVPHERLAGCMSSARLYAQPSHFEGHPKTILEAMFLGRPVLAADAPGVTDLIEESGGGWLCGRSSGEIRQALEQALSSPEELARRGRLAARFARERFSLDAVAPLDAAVLDRLAEGEKEGGDGR